MFVPTMFISCVFLVLGTPCPSLPPPVFSPRSPELQQAHHLVPVHPGRLQFPDLKSLFGRHIFFLLRWPIVTAGCHRALTDTHFFFFSFQSSPPLALISPLCRLTHYFLWKEYFHCSFWKLQKTLIMIKKMLPFINYFHDFIITPVYR